MTIECVAPRFFAPRRTPRTAANGISSSQDEQDTEAKTWQANASSETQDDPTIREPPVDVENQKAQLDVSVEPGMAV
jgi:hypothetical protein